MCSTPLTGIVFDIQRAALYDGPGLRTVVFLKGCPLRCSWCHNPESQACQPETGRSGKQYGSPMSVGEVMETVLADKKYFETSGGGLTVSGGEPTVQFAFCRELLMAATAEGIHTCLDTCGAVPWARLEELAPFVSLFLYDYKATDPECHRALTGLDGGLCRDNLRSLLRQGVPVRLRCPLVPGVNDSAHHLASIGGLMREFRNLEADIMPYHETGKSKYADLGMPLPDLVTHPPEESDLLRWKQCLAAGSGGRIPEFSGGVSGRELSHAVPSGHQSPSPCPSLPW